MTTQTHADVRGSSPPVPTLYSLAEVAEMTRVTVSTVRRWIDAGDLEIVRVGGRIRVEHGTLVDYIAARRERRDRGRAP